LEDPYILLALLTGAAVFVFSIAQEALEHFSKPKILQLLRSEALRHRFDQRYIPAFEQAEAAIVAVRTLAGIVFVAALAETMGGAFSSVWLILLSTAILGALWLVPFCSVLPRAITLHHHDRAATWALFAGYYLSYPCRPLLAVNRFVRKVTFRPVGIDPETSNEREITEDILSAVETGEREGVLENDEKRMIENIMDFKDVEVSEVMTPRTDMFCLDVDTPLDQAVELSQQRPHSRIPVYKETRDEIVGILYVKDLLRHWKQNTSALAISDLMRKPYFIPETKTVGELLQEFQRDKIHIAIVLDEYGGTSGLVTIEDIVEEIVGEIDDEYDLPLSEAPLTLAKDHRSADVDAKLHIDELNEILGIEIPESEDFDTVGGFVFSHLGKVPEVGERVQHENVEFRVTDADSRKINRIEVIVHDGHAS